ncbi:hypothetical protein BCR36DRAFT_124248 [Piromyces finnis]|uniref:Uncharacterized protein n=1 Tax=Piromyces finnis TaxID=1754191 RepID=A0A1Y1V1X8_9FUNG|nr:hypothetical protein BCR36DRAFT_124248 [Piromyces finnis]|eukprot:ORX44642.1 hypothetical protein BCR36DRAFT_124248 [Piromyces finnis]
MSDIIDDIKNKNDINNEDTEKNEIKEIKPHDISRKSTLTQVSINNEDNSWGEILSGGSIRKNLRNSKNISNVNANTTDNENSTISSLNDNDDIISYSYYPHRYSNNKKQSFISYTESINSSNYSDEESNNDKISKRKSISSSEYNDSPLNDDDSTPSPENDYDETDSSSSSTNIDDLISNDDPMLLNIINMSINNYKKNEQPTNTISSKDNSTFFNNNGSSLSKHNSANGISSISEHNSINGISSIANHRRNICFQQNPIVINSIEEEESNHEKYNSSESHINSSSQFTNSMNSSQSTISQIDEEVISPETLARSNTCKEYLEFRYNYINNIITNNQIYNPLFIMRWRTRMWIIQATQGNINTLKKNRKNQDFWYIDNSEITDFNNQYNKTNNVSDNSNDDNKTSIEPLAGNIFSQHNKNLSNMNSEDNSIWKTDDYTDNASERSHIKTSPTNSDINGQNKDKSYILDQNSNSVKDSNRASLYPPILDDNKKALNEEFMSSYKYIFKKLKKHDSNYESDGSQLKKNMENDNTDSVLHPFTSILTHNPSVITNNSSPLSTNLNKNDDKESLINLFIPKAKNRNKKPLLSIITNNLNNATTNNVECTSGISEVHIPNSASILEFSSSQNRPQSKLSTLTEYHSDIGDELTIKTPQGSRNPLCNSRIINSRNRLSEIHSIRKLNENVLTNDNNDKETDNSFLDITHVRGRRSSMPDISRYQSQQFNQSFININNSNKKNKEKNIPNTAVEGSFNNLNYNYTRSYYNLDTPNSTKNPLRKILLRKRGKQNEQQDSGDEMQNGNIKYNNIDIGITASNTYFNNKINDDNNNLTESKSIKKIFNNMDSKGIRSIIKDIQPKFQYDKRQYLIRNDLINSAQSINNNNNNDEVELLNIKPLKDNIECDPSILKKNADDKKKKRNLLNIKKIFERNYTNGSLKNKKNSELLSENELDDNSIRRVDDYTNSWIRSNGEFYNEIEDDAYSNIEVDDTYNDRYNEIMKECSSPNIDFDFTNEEFLKNNPILLNTKIVLTYNPSNTNELYSDNEIKLNDLIELEEKYNNLINIIYKNLEEKMLESIKYNLIKANYCIYNFSKELINMKNLDILKTKEMQNMIEDLDLTNSKNEIIFQKGDVMEKEKPNKNNSFSFDFVNENTTVINSNMTRRKSVINKIYNVKDRSYLFNDMDNTDNEDDSEYTPSVLGSPVIVEEPEDYFTSDSLQSPKIGNDIIGYRRSSKKSSIKLKSIQEYDNKPLINDFNNPTNRNNDIYRNNNLSNDNFRNSYCKDIMEKPKKEYSKKEINEIIQNIDKQYDDFENMTNAINLKFNNNNNKIETIINDSKEVSNTLNNDLLIRMKVFEENKQNKTYFKRNIASEIGFITLDYFLTLIGGLYWLFYKFLKALKIIVLGTKIDYDENKETHDNDKSDSSKDKIYHGISSSSLNKENSLSIGKINNSNEINSKRIYNIDSNNLSTNITENFRENMKRITDLINNSYNKSLEEENQIINIQKKLHELRSSNKPVNKDDIYSLIRGTDTEQKADSNNNIKMTNDKSNNQENILVYENNNKESNYKACNKSIDLVEKTSITDSNNIERNRSYTNEDKTSNVENDKDIDIKNNIENSDKHDNYNSNINNNNNNTNNKSSNCNCNIDNNNKSSNCNCNIDNNNNVEINNDSNNKINSNNSIHENNLDILMFSDNENDDVNSYSNNGTMKKKFGNKFKTLLKSKSFTDKREMNSTKNLVYNFKNQYPNNQSNITITENEIKESPVKRKPSLARRASKLLNINNIKSFRNKERENNKIDENVSPISIPNDNNHENYDISYLISLSQCDESSTKVNGNETNI